MKRVTKLDLLFLVSIIFISISFGFYLHKYHIIPYAKLKWLLNQHLATHSHNNKITENRRQNHYGFWSIGIYKGSTPFNLFDPEDIENPVISAKDITDIDADFVADPFLIFKDNTYFLFFEVLNRVSGHGDIGYAESKNITKWTYKKIIIDENFHLSYPYVFEWEKKYYLIPESSQDLSVRLYRANSFPDSWEYEGNLLSGFPYTDPSVFRYQNKWWLFISIPGHNVLNLFYSDNLIKGWQPHPLNPIVKFNKHIARPGGRILIFKDKIYRFAQDDEPRYGLQVYAFEVTELSEKSYNEVKLLKNPIIKMTGKGWNATGMHHLDLQSINNQWVAAVDGRSL